jgi:hypothetical protein
LTVGVWERMAEGEERLCDGCRDGGRQAWMAMCLGLLVGLHFIWREKSLTLSHCCAVEGWRGEGLARCSPRANTEIAPLDIRSHPFSNGGQSLCMYCISRQLQNPSARNGLCRVVHARSAAGQRSVWCVANFASR